MKLVIIGLLVLFFGDGLQTDSTKELHLTVSNLKNNNVQVGVRVFNQSKGFPTERSKVYKEYFVKPKNNKAQVTLKLNPGVYAIASIHDENSNKELDKNFFGIPIEGLGTSNNPKIRFGPPSFNDAKFNFNKSGQKVTINMNYF